MIPENAIVKCRICGAQTVDSDTYALMAGESASWPPPVPHDRYCPRDEQTIVRY
jgi:hypothetical protein